MLVWVKDLALIWANLLHASIPWGNTNDPFLEADTQESSSCLPVFQGPGSFEERPNGSSNLCFHYTEEDATRSLRAYVPTLQGVLHCGTDVQVAHGSGMLLKYVFIRHRNARVCDQ